MNKTQDVVREHKAALLFKPATLLERLMLLVGLVLGWPKRKLDALKEKRAAKKKAQLIQRERETASETKRQQEAASLAVLLYKILKMEPGEERRALVAEYDRRAEIFALVYMDRARYRPLSGMNPESADAYLEAVREQEKHYTGSKYFNDLTGDV